MAEVTLIRCPKCQCQTWNDIPNSTERERTWFVCSRCAYTIRIGACSRCQAKSWAMVSGIDPRGPQRPIYRLRCGGCGRVIGVVIDNPLE